MSGSPDARAVSFGKVVEAYDRARPSYPDAAVDWMLPAGARRVLDLGAGTGKLTRSLVARGLETLAVDPSPDMLARLKANLPGVDARLGSAEDIPLPDACVDAVVVGQAWHWVDEARAVPEIARVLRPGGTLAPVWNVRDDRVAWVARLSRLLEGDGGPTYTGPPIIGAPFSPLQSHDVAGSYDVDEATFADLARSRSETIEMADHEREALLARLVGLFEEAADANGVLRIPYLTHAFRSVRAS